MGRLVLGVQIGHDRSVAAVRDGQIVAAIEEERLDRRKHSAGRELPLKALSWCLGAAGATIAEVDEFAVTSTRPPAELHGLELLNGRWFFVPHHLAHAAAAFLTSGHDRAAVVVADGSGGKAGNGLREAESVYLGHGTSIDVQSQRLAADTKERTASEATSTNVLFGDLSLGNLYSAVSRVIFGDWRYAGKVMALAGLVPGGARPRPDAEACRRALDTSTARRLDVRRPAEFARAVELAALTHETVRQGMLNYVAGATSSLGVNVVCLGGGVAYNCVINSDVAAANSGRSVHVFPACGDSGNAVGAALLVGGCRLDQPAMPFWGNAWPRDEVLEAIVPYLVKNYLAADVAVAEVADEKLPGFIAEDLRRHVVVGVLRGRSELGPRALGHRSVLADPAAPGVKSFLNGIKGREWFRPFGVMVREEDTPGLFGSADLSPYMMRVGRLDGAVRGARFDVSHADGTTRLQTVSAKDMPFHDELLRTWATQTGTPYLINTSFNVAGEPLVETPVDAVRAAIRMRLPIAYVGGVRLAFRGAGG